MAAARGNAAILPYPRASQARYAAILPYSRQSQARARLVVSLAGAAWARTAGGSRGHGAVGASGGARPVIHRGFGAGDDYRNAKVGGRSTGARILAQLSDGGGGEKGEGEITVDKSKDKKVRGGDRVKPATSWVRDIVWTVVKGIVSGFVTMSVMGGMLFLIYKLGYDRAYAHLYSVLKKLAIGCLTDEELRQTASQTVVNVCTRSIKSLNPLDMSTSDKLKFGVVPGSLLVIYLLKVLFWN